MGGEWLALVLSWLGLCLTVAVGTCAKKKPAEPPPGTPPAKSKKSTERTGAEREKRTTESLTPKAVLEASTRTGAKVPHSSLLTVPSLGRQSNPSELGQTGNTGRNGNTNITGHATGVTTKSFEGEAVVPVFDAAAVSKKTQPMTLGPQTLREQDKERRIRAGLKVPRQNPDYKTLVGINSDWSSSDDREQPTAAQTLVLNPPSHAATQKPEECARTAHTSEKTTTDKPITEESYENKE